MDQDQHEDRGDQPGGSRRTRVIVIVGVVLVILGVGIAATVMTISANQQRAQEETLTAIAQAGQATNTAQIAAVQTQQADQTTSTAYFHETAAANQTITQQAVEATETAKIDIRETARAENAAATQTLLDSFTALIEEAQANPPIYGPSSGSLYRSQQPFVVSHRSGVRVTNFVAEVSFVTPFDRTVGPFDFGLIFREATPNIEYRLSLDSNGDWEVTNGTDAGFSTPAFDHVAGMSLSVGSTNSVRLLVNEGLMVFYLNDEFVRQVDISSRIEPGDISVATQLFNYHDDFYEPGTTDYVDFTIWRLP